MLNLKVDGSSGDKQLEEDIARRFEELYAYFKSVEFDASLRETLGHKFDLWKKKQRSYGPNNIAALGMKGIFVRVWDKVQRLRNLVWLEQENPLEDESVEDTFGDLAIYSIMAVVLMRKQWPEYLETPLEGFLTPELLDKLKLTIEHKPVWEELKGEKNIAGWYEEGKLTREQLEELIRERDHNE